MGDNRGIAPTNHSQNAFLMSSTRLTLTPLVMSMLAVTSAVLISPTLAQNQPTANPLDSEPETATAAELEAQVLEEINRLRTNPPRYAQWLRTLRRYYDGTTLQLPGEPPVTTQEGIAALEEAIAALENRRPVLPLSASAPLNLHVQGMLRDRASLGEGHQLLNHRTPLWSILQWVVADGDRSRQGREALLSINHHAAGIACDAIAALCVVSYDGQTNIATSPVLPSAQIPIAVQSLPEPIIPEPIIPEPTADTVLSNPEIPNPETSNPETPIAEFSTPPTPEIPIPIPVTPPSVAALTTSKPITPEPITPEPTETVVSQLESPVTTTIADLPSLPPASTNARDIAMTTAEARSLTNPTLAARSLVPIANLLTPDPDAVNQGYLLIREGALENSDSRYEDGSLYDEYLVQGEANQAITIDLTSSKFDTFLAVFDAEGQSILAQNDDAEDSSNSRVTLTLPEDGLYRIFVNGYNESDRGEYTITVR